MWKSKAEIRTEKWVNGFMKKAKQRLENVACDWYKGVSEEKKIGEYAKSRKKTKSKRLWKKYRKYVKKREIKKKDFMEKVERIQKTPSKTVLKKTKRWVENYWNGCRN